MSEPQISISETTYREVVAALIESHEHVGVPYEGSLQCALWAALDGNPELVLHELAESLLPAHYGQRT